MSTVTREVIKGVVGGAGFLLFAFVADVPLLLAAGLAAGLYVSMSFLLPKPVTEDSDALGLTLQERNTFIASCRKSSADLAQLGASVRHRAFSERIGALVRTADGLTDYFEKKPETILLAYSVPRNLEHLVGMLRQYVAINNFQQAGQTAQEAMRKVEGIFEAAASSFVSMQQQLLDNDAAALEASAHTLAILMETDAEIRNERVRPFKESDSEPPRPPRIPLPGKETQL